MLVGGGWGGAHARAQGPRARAYAPGSRAQGPGPLGLWAQGPEPRAQAPDPSLWPRAWSGQFLARAILDAVFKKHSELAEKIIQTGLWTIIGATI